MAGKAHSVQDRHQETAGNAARIFVVILLIHVLAVGAAVAWQGMRRWQQPMMAFRLDPASEAPLNTVGEIREAAASLSAPPAQTPARSTAPSLAAEAPPSSSKPLHHLGHVHVGQGALSMAAQKLTPSALQTQDDAEQRKAPSLASTKQPTGTPSTSPATAAHWSISMATPVPDLPHPASAGTNAARPASPPTSPVSQIATTPAPTVKSQDVEVASSSRSTEAPVSHKMEEKTSKPISHLHVGSSDTKPNHVKIIKPGTTVSALIAGGSYRVHKGETFYSIARKLHVKLHDLMALNPDRKAGGLYEGVKLKLPSKHNANGSATRQS